MTNTELKVVMFTDEADSTARMKQRTSDQNEEVDREKKRLTAEVFALARGVILKDTGDGYFAQFPSVLKAVCAAVPLQQRVAARNRAQTPEATRFELRVCIDVGELLVLDGDLKGDAANRCARICPLCPPGEVYLSEAAALMLNPNEVVLEKVGTFDLKGIAGAVTVYRVVALLVECERAPNPFIWRGGITRAEDFFDHDNEQRALRAYLGGRQNCQIVGPRRFGKTSLLRQVERAAPAWDKSTEVAYLDLQDPHCFTLAGWLKFASRQFRWPTAAATLVDFADHVEASIDAGRRPVLLLDEFEELTARRAEFARDFFLTLRSCAQRGLSVVTASRRPLNELTDRGDPTSPFYNTFPLLRLGAFNEAAARDFLNLYRPGIPAFTPEEQAAIEAFAKGNPLCLQVACFHVLEARASGASLTTAIQNAAAEIKGMLPDGC